ncbi:chitinase 3 [Drosophila subpulchrella]|uniref:chitinase 3 n=1 Tax=Drosophila subpulchrella TaxID=1486046 RepID=UPI0018A1A990|nr:chitinase 3 [Drosophila subpulchrella]
MEHHFVILLIVSLMGNGYFLGLSEAQTFTAQDRNSIQKFMDSLISFLELEASNVTTSTTLAPSSNGTSLETTSLAAGNSTEVTTEVSRTSTNSTSSVLDSTTSSVLDSTTSSVLTTSTSSLNSTTVANTTTTISTTTSQPTTIRTRICFKRFCYKFSNDKGYIV